MARANIIVETTIEKMVFGGQGLGRVDGKALFVWGALPGERVQVRLTRNKKDYAEGVVETILEAAPQRQAPVDDHYLSCSPWQIMSFPDEQHWKQALAEQVYYPLRSQYDLERIAICGQAEHAVGYRNKIEYSFWQDEAGLHFAFFGRGTHQRQAIDLCVLAKPCINQQAQRILDWLRTAGVTAFDLKSLIIVANDHNQVTAALFCKKSLTFEQYPPLDDTLLGLTIYYSNPKSPASVPTELLYAIGTQELTTTVFGTPLRHSILGFFQVNIPLFTQALQAIQPWLDNTTPVIDYYAGVGSISIPLSPYYQSARLVEQNSEAVQAAQMNITALQLTEKCQTQCMATEVMLEAIQSDQIIIVDPPRAGLSPVVIERLLLSKPKRVIYLSCNLSTQSRDVNLLLSSYSIRHIELFNFFPRTPHIEGLVVLDRCA